MSIALITIIIIAANVIFSLKGFQDPVFFNRYKFQTGAVLNGKQYDRILSSGFLHVDYTHLIFNMLTLYFFANVVIQFFAAPSYFVYGSTGVFNMTTGYIMFAVVFLAAVIGGNLLALFFQKNNPHYSAVGASGGVSGVLFAAIVIAPVQLEIYGFIPGWLFAMLYLGYSVYGMQKQLGNIGHEAHLGGAIIGLIAPILFYPEIFTVNKIYILGMLVPIAVLLVLAIQSAKK
ncbi:MAG: rhomboid family intramembrane serine protease [Moheibacter sp.]